MPSRNQYKHHYLQSLPEADLQQLAERCRDWAMDSVVFAALLSNWFKNFDKPDDHPLALKLLNSIDYYNEARFNELLQERRASVRRYLIDKNLNESRIWFAMPDARADSAAHHAYRLSKVWGLPVERFVSFDDIARQLGANITSADTLILFNDTYGSGKQFMEEVWPGVQPLLSRVGAVLIVGAMIAGEAQTRFRAEALGAHIIPENIVKPINKNVTFSREEVERLTELGNRVYSSHPQGFDGCGLLLAYHFQCPNNSLPLIWADGKNNAVSDKAVYPWNPLFPYRPKTKAPPALDEVEDESHLTDREKIGRKISRLLAERGLLALQRALNKFAQGNKQPAQTPGELLCPQQGETTINVLMNVFNPALEEVLADTKPTSDDLKKIMELIGWVVVGMVNHAQYKRETFLDIAPQPNLLQIGCQMPDLTLLIMLNHGLMAPLTVELKRTETGRDEIVSKSAIKPLSGCISDQANDEVLRILQNIWERSPKRIYQPPTSLDADEWGDLDGKLKNTNARKNHRFTYFHQGAIADAVLAGVRKKLPNLRIFMVSEGNGQPLLLATDKDIAQFLVFNMGELLDYEKTHL